MSSRKNYVRGEVNEEDVGEVKAGMKATCKCTPIALGNSAPRSHPFMPAADPETQRYTVVLDLENRPKT